MANSKSILQHIKYKDRVRLFLSLCQGQGGSDLYLTRWRVQRSCRSLGDEVPRVMTLQSSLKYSGAQVASTEWSVEASVAECDFTEWTAQGQTVHLGSVASDHLHCLCYGLGPLLDHVDQRNELLAQSSFENQGKFAKPG